MTSVQIFTQEKYQGQWEWPKFPLRPVILARTHTQEHTLDRNCFGFCVNGQNYDSNGSNGGDWVLEIRMIPVILLRPSLGNHPDNAFSLCSHPTLWRPEYGSYMIEGTPGQPYGGTMSEFNTVEGNMGKRRREASSVLNQNQTLCTITSFPMYPHLHSGSFYSSSLLFCGDKSRTKTNHLYYKLIVTYKLLTVISYIKASAKNN